MNKSIRDFLGKARDYFVKSEQLTRPIGEISSGEMDDLEAAWAKHKELRELREDEEHS